jgi:predicted transcriptional regulator
MSSNPVTAWPDADVADIAQLMLHHDIRSVPILDHGDLVGIVSRRDIVGSLIRTDDTVAREISHRLDGYAGGEHRWEVSVHDGVAGVVGAFDDEVEREVVSIMVRTVPGVARVRLVTG